MSNLNEEGTAEVAEGTVGPVGGPEQVTVAPPVSESGKSFDEVVKEVIAGKWGQGQEQRLRLSEAGFNPNEVRKEITRLRNHL